MRVGFSASEPQRLRDPELWALTISRLLLRHVFAHCSFGCGKPQVDFTLTSLNSPSGGTDGGLAPSEVAAAVPEPFPQWRPRTKDEVRSVPRACDDEDAATLPLGGAHTVCKTPQLAGVGPAGRVEKYKIDCACKNMSRVARSVSAPGSHRSRRESRDSPGSCHPGHQTMGTVLTQTQWAKNLGRSLTACVHACCAFLRPFSRRYLFRNQRSRYALIRASRDESAER